jgi:hypothetical protein
MTPPRLRSPGLESGPQAPSSTQPNPRHEPGFGCRNLLGVPHAELGDRQATSARNNPQPIPRQAQTRPSRLVRGSG